MTPSGRPPSLLILGLGNVLCGDDGLGVAATELLCRRYRLPDGARVLDGGTLGLTLLSYIQPSDDVILVDAIRADGPAGSLVRLEADEVGPAVRERLSVHQIGVADLLEGLRLLDAYPRSLVLLGLVPETLALGLGRSPAVERQLPQLVDEVVREAQRRGYEFRPWEGDEAVRAGGRDPAARALGL
jgi:hydrogenase maturation protease